MDCHLVTSWCEPHLPGGVRVGILFLLVSSSRNYSMANAGENAAAAAAVVQQQRNSPGLLLYFAVPFRFLHKKEIKKGKSEILINLKIMYSYFLATTNAVTGKQVR